MQRDDQLAAIPPGRFRIAGFTAVTMFLTAPLPGRHPCPAASALSDGFPRIGFDPFAASRNFLNAT